MLVVIRGVTLELTDRRIEHLQRLSKGANAMGVLFISDDATCKYPMTVDFYANGDIYVELEDRPGFRLSAESPLQSLRGFHLNGSTVANEIRTAVGLGEPLLERDIIISKLVEEIRKLNNQ